jgi:parallel beta-helix repeat protein
MTVRRAVPERTGFLPTVRVMNSPRRPVSSRGRLLLVVLAGLLLVAGLAALRAERRPPRGAGGVASLAPSDCGGTRVQAGGDPQEVLDGQPEGASFCFSAGSYRLAAPLRPKAGQRLVAEPGAVLDGSRVVGGWQRSGREWSATGYLPAEAKAHGECVQGYGGCRYAEAVFLDDRQLWRVDSRDQLAPGRFYEDYGANAIWIADDPDGHLVEVARTGAAVTGTVEGVLLEGFVVEKFANPAQDGAVQARGRDWRIRRNDVRLNHGVGVEAAGGQVLGNHLHHNGQLGLAGTGDDQLVAGNEIDHNNTAGFSALWEAGGTKWAETRHLVVRGNSSHDNQGPGLWTDINNVDTLYEGNTVHANASHGIFHEISYDAVIRNNRVTDNGRPDRASGWGGAGIRVAGSPNVEVYGNFLAGNSNGIILLQQQRTDWPSPYGPHELHDVDVHDNDVAMSGNVTGMVNDTGDESVYGRNIRFRHNTYRLRWPEGRFFAWRGEDWDRHAWTRRFGHDTTGSFQGPIRSVLPGPDRRRAAARA